MRANEFITEAAKKGILSKRKRYSTRGLHKFQDVDGRDRTYELNRVMMAAATASGEGPNEVIDLDSESWVGTFNTAVGLNSLTCNTFGYFFLYLVLL